MSRMVSVAGPPSKPLSELDIDELVDRLTSEEIQKLLDECDPDDPHIPPYMRTNYKCDKASTGPLDRQKLLDFINDQALNTPDIPEAVPYVPGTLRGKKWLPPPKPQESSTKLFDDGDGIELDLDLGDGTESALGNASTADIVDLAGILGLHSMMNQDQFHSAQSDVWAPKADPNIGWNGVTKATPLKEYPPEEPNRTNPEEVVSKLRDNNDPEYKEVNLNNVPVSEAQFLEIFDALRHNETLEELSLANTTLGDYAAANLACSLENNKHLEKLNLESNNVSPQTLVKLFEAVNVQQVIKEIKGSNQKAQFLGNKVEMAITKAIENNKTLLKIGLHFEYGDCRNRVAVQLQKNLDRVRLRRVALKLSNTAVTTSAQSTNRTGGYLGGLPGQLTAASIPKQKEMTPASDAGSSEYEYYYEYEEGSR